MNDNNVDWDYIREQLQNLNYFEREGTLCKTKDPIVFKNHFKKYVQKEIDYATDKFQKSK